MGIEPIAKAYLDDYFIKYGFNGEDRKYPSGAVALRDNSGLELNLHNSPRISKFAANITSSEKFQRFGSHGPVVISILEDHQELVLNFLGTLQRFFGMELATHQEPYHRQQFLSDSPVYVAWATSPQDLKKVHRKIVRNLNAKGCSTDQINFLNILDYNTNIRQPNGQMMAAGQAQGEAGGLQAMRYLAQYYQGNPCNATLLQTSFYNANMDRESKTVLSQTKPMFNCVYEQEKEIHHPHRWSLGPNGNAYLHTELHDLWEATDINGAQQIPVAAHKLLWASDYNAIFNAPQAEATNNEPLIKVLQAFDQFIRNVKPTLIRANSLTTASDGQASSSEQTCVSNTGL